MQQKPRVRRFTPLPREGSRPEPLAAFERPLQILLRMFPRPVPHGLGHASAVDPHQASADKRLLLGA